MRSTYHFSYSPDSSSLLERVGAQIDEKRRAQRHQRLLPDVKALVLLLEEHDLPLIVAQAGEVAVVGPVEELLALVGPAGEQVALVVAVEMDLEGLAARVVAVEQLLLDVRLARGRRQGRQPVLAGETMPLISVCGLTTPASASRPGRDSRLPSWCSSRCGTASCRRPARRTIRRRCRWCR